MPSFRSHLADRRLLDVTGVCMTCSQLLRRALDRGETLLVRGHGMAGSGLTLAFQALGAAAAAHRDLKVQQWPCLPASRRGAPVVAWLRVARHALDAAAPLGPPDVAVALEAGGGAFAQGACGALYVLNTLDSPEQAAARWGLGGTVVTVDGDALGRKYLGRPLGNVAMLGALGHAVGLEPQALRTSLREQLRARGLAQAVVEANLALLAEAPAAARSADLPQVGAGHPAAPFKGFGALPAGAQTGLRGPPKGWIP